MCAHGRSIFLWTESISEPDGFVSWHCEDELKAGSRQCELNNVTATMGEHIYFRCVAIPPASSCSQRAEYCSAV